MTNNPVLKKIFFAFGVFLMLIVLSVIFLFISTLKKPTQQIPEKKPVTQVDISTPLVNSVLPPVTKLLETGKIQTFTSTLDPTIEVSDVKVTLSSSPPSNASAKSVVPTTTSLEGKVLVTTTSVPIEPSTTYTLMLLYKGKIILSQAYLSAHPIETPIPTNNPTLSTYLPYETLNYLLVYNAEKNAYVMHFKYDPNSSKDLNTQFEEAKTNTNNFIVGKGIDVTTITIDYLFK